MQWTEVWEHLGWPAIIVASVLGSWAWRRWRCSSSVCGRSPVAPRRGRSPRARSHAAAGERRDGPGRGGAPRGRPPAAPRALRADDVSRRAERPRRHGLTPVESMRRELSAASTSWCRPEARPAAPRVGRIVAPFVGCWDGARHRHGVPRHRDDRLRRAVGGVRRYRRSAGRDRARAGGGDPRRPGLQLPGTQIGRDQLALTNAPGS